MRITSLVQRILQEESDAVKQAHALGLEHDGWGYWIDPKTGKRVAKSVQGKLVKLQSPEEPERTQAVQQTATAAPPRLKLKPVDDDPYGVNQTALQKPNIDSDMDAWVQGFQPKISPNRDPNWIDTPDAEIAESIRKVLTDPVEHGLEAAIAIGKAMGVDPDLTVEFNDPKCDFAMANGIHSFADKTISYSVKTTERLFVHYDYGPRIVDEVMQEIAEYKDDPTRIDQLRKFNYVTQVGSWRRALHTVIHENVHGKDPKLAMGSEYSTSAFLVEGLTERKTRQIHDALFPDPAPNRWKVIQAAYSLEVASLDALEAISPGACQDIWKYTTGERVDRLEQLIVSGIDNMITTLSAGDAQKQQAYAEIRQRYTGRILRQMFMAGKFLAFYRALLSGELEDFENQVDREAVTIDIEGV